MGQSRSKCALEAEAHVAGFRRTERGIPLQRALRCCVLAAAVLVPPRLQAQTTVTNTAAATYETVAGTDSVGSNTVETDLVFAVLFLEMRISGPSSGRIGEEIQYTIRYGNSSATATAREVVLIDSLPVGLEFVSSSASSQVAAQVVAGNLGGVASAVGFGLVSSQLVPQVAGQVVTWNLGEVAPGDSAELVLTARVSEDVRDTLQVRNVAVLTALSFAGEAAVVAEAEAAAVQLIGVNRTQLALEKSADVLEVRLSETVPYTLTVENTGSMALAYLRIHDSLPEGAGFARRSVLGADSVQVNGRELTIFIGGLLAPGATHTVRYAVAVVSAENEVIANRAYATAEEDAFVRSEEVVAWVRVRRGWPMETRTVIGKVWADLDGDGVQDAGEPGVDGIDIWTDDGEVATTDSEGKFSFRNVRPGGHAFRLDRTTLPAAYRYAGGGSSEDLVAIDVGGWTTPRVNFRVLPSMGTVERVYLLFSWRFTARPVRQADRADSTAVGEDRTAVVESDAARGEPTFMAEDSLALRQPLILQGVEFEFGGARLTPESHTILDEVAQSLAAHPDVRIEIAGHTDSTGSRALNMELALERASAVRQYLVHREINPSLMAVRGYGQDRPIAPNATASGRAQNRRVEVHVLIERGTTQGISLQRHVRALFANAQPVKRLDEIIQSPAVASDADSYSPLFEYEVVIENDYDVALAGLAVRFAPAVDSAVMVYGDSTLVLPAGSRILLPPVAPHSQLTVRAWAVGEKDSAVAVVESTLRSADRQIALVRNPLRSAEGTTFLRAISDSLPPVEVMPPGGEIQVVFAPRRTGWPTLTYPLPTGWELVSGSARIGDAPAPDPEVRKDRSGQPVLHWEFGDRALAPVTLRLRPAGVAGVVRAVEPVRVGALRTAEEREAEQQRTFMVGPGVEMVDPVDGTVLRSDRVYVGVRGEPGAAVALFDGDSLLAEGTIRVDGLHDFIAVPLVRGPHRLRVRMVNSWQRERWDSMQVHVTGLPASFVAPAGPVQLVADGHSLRELRVRVLDRWGVPVVQPSAVTLSAEGAELVNADAEPSSVGVQVRTDGAGWLAIQLKPGREVGRGQLLLEAGGASQVIDLELLPAIRPLMVTGVGRVGVGASPEAFGAITARGRLDRRTSIVLSYDSRRLDAGRNVFGRDYDPLEEAQYPILGDASQVRTVSASRNAFSARVERGLDWVVVGDVATNDFASGLTLTTYRRALTGGAARLTTGPVVWRGFGSLTRQNLQQLQLRGAGMSGPYQLQPDIIQGTEQIVLETRAGENAQRVVSREVLVRFVDYQIDYERGTLLFKRPVPAADAYENPIFIMVTYEAESGGERRMVGGLRATVAAGELLGSRLLDSLRVGVTGIRSDEATGPHYLAGADMRLLRSGAVDLRAEISYSETPDSSGFATAIDGGLHLLNRALSLSASWMKIGSGFGNPSNRGLRGGTEEVKLGGDLRVGPSVLRVQHERQSFDAQGVGRQRTRAGIVQSVGAHMQVDVAHTADHFDNGSGDDRSRAGEVRMTWTPLAALSIWGEGRRQFSYSGNLVRPNHIAGGAAFQVNRQVSLELQHRRVFQPEQASYSVTNIGMRTNLGLGTQAWGSYQLAGGAGGRHNAAVVGLNNRLRLGAAWTVNTLFERRVGLDRASVTEPVRALPFLRTEEDYWSLGFGLEWLPPDAPYRMSARSEYRDGDALSSRLVTLAGDVSFNRSLALLSRQEFLRTERGGAGEATLSRRLSTLWGVAFRPIGSDVLNILTKFSWLKETNPLGGGVLSRQGEEQRLIGAAELIWAPSSRTELAGRYALRRTLADRLHGDGVEQKLESWADYIGARFNVDVARWFAVRSEGRLLIERTSDTRRWDAAPSLVLLPIEQLEVATGYRFGNLRDPDFAVRGGHGWFLTLGVRFTEGSLRTAADFWRARFGR